MADKKCMKFIPMATFCNLFQKMVKSRSAPVILQANSAASIGGAVSGTKKKENFGKKRIIRFTDYSRVEKCLMVRTI